MAVKLYGTLGACIEQVKPTNKRGTKPHPKQSGTEKGPVNPVKGLLLVK